MRIDRRCLSLERIIFAWNVTELICWRNRNDNDIKLSTETSHWYQKPMASQAAERPAEVPGMRGDAVQNGMGALRHSPWKIMASWYDGQPEWPNISMPQRLLQKRKRGKFTSRLETEWRPDGKWPTQMPVPAGEKNRRCSVTPAVFAAILRPHSEPLSYQISKTIFFELCAAFLKQKMCLKNLMQNENCDKNRVAVFYA